MAFDQATRNRLARFVGDARALLTEEFTRQLQLEYGLDPASGTRVELDRLTQLDDARRATAVVLRETLDHYLAATSAKGQKATQEALDRIVREQAFTVLNRLCALRMAEARGIIIESVAQGYQSKGFQLYERLVGTALGETGEAYRAYFFSLCDELAVDLPVLFDRFAPEGRLFPRESALLELLGLLNHSDLTELWAADETVGWVYQYFNSKDERQAMRAASQAPRNSRELAVRNQFFTPRYVVEFLADNTLGRTWYEMTQGQTALVDRCRYLVRRPNEIFLAPGAQAAQAEPAEGLSQEQLLQQPVYIPHRPLKDPRAILMLDPACGSMHFGLYAFDLFERIYDEAWEWEAERGPQALERAAIDAPLHAAYPNKEVFLRDVPRLIVERNIHGIDIDPRAAQIAGLALWLRAQRSWREQGVKAQDRPQITRSNIVCAEPMPGDPALLDEFVTRELAATPEDKVVAQMLRRVFKAMELAGEAGSLLKIEEEIRTIIAEGKKQAAQGPRYDQANLFGETPRPRQAELDLDASGLTDETFWQQAEERIYAALAAYAGFAEGCERFYRRRLFADDARQGFAFIDLCRKLYDVVLMNPPFGDASSEVATYLAKNYPDTKNDIYASFIERGLDLALSFGFVGAITSRTGFFLSSLEAFRKLLIKKTTVHAMADLGLGVLDAAMVQTASYILENRPSVRFPARYFLLLNKENKEDALRSLVNLQSCEGLYVSTFEDFALLPGLPFAYWAPIKFRLLAAKHFRLEEEGREVRQGLASSDDFRFLRTWWEVSTNYIGRQERWVYFAKGGESTPFFADIHLLIDWKEKGGLLKALAAAKWGSASRTIKSTDRYFSPGLTYTSYTVLGFHPRVLPAECIFSVAGMHIFLPGEDLWYSLGLLSSSFAKAFLSLITDGRKFEAGYVKAIPFISSNVSLENEQTTRISTYAKRAFEATRSMSELDETTHDFLGPPIFEAISYTKKLPEMIDITTKKHSRFRIVAQEMRNNLNNEVSYLYKVDENEIDQCLSISTVTMELQSESTIDGGMTEVIWNLSYVLGRQLFSWLVGCTFGRWDIRFATGECPAPELPDPFAPLPVCPPGMLQNAQGLPAVPEEVPANYPLRISWPGILVDDAGHAEDIVGRAREAITVIWGARAEAIEQEACEILGVKTLRDYFARPANFFADHLARYSKSRRQAPIYWPLAFGSNYTLWLYYHRLSDQSLYSCVNDFVEPKLKLVEEQLAVLRQQGGRSAKEEKELERLDGLRQELQGLREELLRVAAFWKPNLNDGVQITAAPLWRLFQHKPWQKRLKETWDKLEQGEYDWAHLAYSIWPERVRAKCKTDKSLAIAHDVEELYVEVPAAAKKGKRMRDEG